MNARRILACIATAWLIAGCSAYGVSGTYVARGQDFVEMLQITQAQDGQLLGSISNTTLKPDGSIAQDATNISGVANGNTLTLVAKSPIPLIPGVNMPGVLKAGVITITTPGGQEQFTTSSPDGYEAVVRQLQGRGAVIQQQKHLAEEDASVADLNKRLADYAAMVQQPKIEEQLATFHAEHTKALERARHGLETQQKYPKGSFNAGQVAFAIGQIQFQLQLYDNNWDGTPGQARTRIREFDAAISISICHTHENLTNCARQPAAVEAYQAVRPLTLLRGDDIEATLKNDNAAMQTIVANANAYERDHT